MLHFTFTGNDILETHCERTLVGYINRMPNGEFINLHDNKLDTCIGIALLVKGDVVALHRVCSLNPLKIRDQEVKLSTYSTGGTFSCRHDESLEDAILRYNHSLSYYSTECAIIAYYIFNEEGDSNNVKTEFEETENTLNDLKSIRESFMAHHKERMNELAKEINSLNIREVALDYRIDETTKKLEDISNKLDELLASF